MATTPQGAARHTPGAPDSTKAPRGPAGPLPKHTPTHAVTGPTAWENGRDTTSTPSGPPPHHNPAPSFKAHQDSQVTSTVGVNPNPPAQESRSVQADTSLPLVAGGPVDPFGPYSDAY
jgi:hypothetical protein